MPMPAKLVRAIISLAACGLAAPAPPPPMETISIRVHEGTTLALDLSPDGRRMAFDLLGQLWTLPAGGGTARALTDAVRDTAEDLDPSWSPDGRQIVFRGERRGRTGLWLVPATGGIPHQLTQLANPDGFHGQAAWSPDGSLIAFTDLVPPRGASRAWRSRIALIAAAGGEIQGLSGDSARTLNLSAPAWAPDGSRLAMVESYPGREDGGRLWISQWSTGQLSSVSHAPPRVLSPAFAPDGHRIAFFAPDSAERLQLWVMPADTLGGAPVRLTNQADVTPTRARWTRDARALVYGADGRIWRVAATGGAPEELRFTADLSIRRPRRELPPAHFPAPGVTQDVRAYMGLALAPDARRIAMLALGKLWVMPVGGTPRALADVPMDAHHLAWSPDGATLVWSAGPWREEDLFAAQVATGSIRRLTTLPGREDHPMFSPDGAHLAFMQALSEDSSLLRVADWHAGDLSSVTESRVLPASPGGDAVWAPSSQSVLYITGGWSPRQATQAMLLGLSGERTPMAGIPDSPLFPAWTVDGLVFERHARLWRARHAAAGFLPPEPLGRDAALYLSAAGDGTILFLSEGGLMLRSPDGHEQALGWPLSYTPPVATPLLIRNARIIDGSGAPATSARDLLIEHGRIGKIADGGTIAAGSARVLDAEGKFLIPGLMDLHAHEYRPALLPGFPYFGVTTIRDQGSAIGPLVAYRDAIAAGKVPGPRVDFGGIQFYTDWAYDTEDGQGAEPEADPEHVVRAVALASMFGSDHVKTRTFRRWDLNARFITEAHRRGMRVTGHCSHLLPLVAAGMDAKEHAGFCEPRGDGIIHDDLVQLYRAAGIGVVPTISYSALAVRLNEQPGALDADSGLAPFLSPKGDFAWMLQLDSAGHREFMHFREWARQATLKLARAGVTIGTGTDIWQIPTGVHLEMEEMVAAGLTPLEALHAATGGAARIVGAQQELGTITVGKWADLVLLDADPSADIRNTRRIRAVIQAGQLLDRGAILARATASRRPSGGPGR